MVDSYNHYDKIYFSVTGLIVLLIVIIITNCTACATVVLLLKNINFTADMGIKNVNFGVTYSGHSIVDVLDLAVPTVGMNMVHSFGQLDGPWWFQSAPQNVHLVAYGEQFPKEFYTVTVQKPESSHKLSTQTCCTSQAIPNVMLLARRKSMWERYVCNNICRINCYFLKLKCFSK